MMLDDDLRRELGKLEEPLPVAHATRYEGVAAFVRMNGPTLVRRARIRRVVVRTAIPAGVIAIAAAVAIGIFTSASEPPREADRAPPAPVEAPAPVAPENVAPIPELAVQDEPVRECESRTPAEASRTDSHVELGFAAFSRERRSRVEVAALEPCRTELRLTSGSVLVHARDLGGGELAVHTDLGDVVVTGTIFRVTRGRDGLIVEVVEGSVDVRSGGTTVGSVRAGERLELERGAIDTRAMAEDRIERLRDIAAEWASRENVTARAREAGHERIESQRTETVEVVPADLAAAAEAARRAGDYRSARSLFRALAQGSTATAESALVRLARMELGVSGPRAALAVLRDRRARFGSGALEPEALTIEHTALARLGDRAGAIRIAERLADSYPRTAQGQRAREWLDANR